MSLTPSTMLPLGTPAPAFRLPDTVSGQMLSLEQVRGGSATVIMFLCNHCPYVQHLNAGLVQLAHDYAGRGVGFAAISSNDARHYPEDGPEPMRDAARRLGYPFPYLYDQTQDVARAYQAACTPDFFVFDAGLRLAYRGRFDDSSPGNGKPVTGAELRAALDALLAGQTPDPQQHPSLGCNIKWAR
jgi:thiol-disulfide isomerase/thioredoxin